MAGIFITMEGIEGSGKSTQVELLREFFEEEGAGVLAIREPGGVWLAEMIRPILLNRAPGMEMEPMAELLLYEACRSQLVKTIIRPALEKGRVVICDRFTDSTTAYQGYARGIDLKAVGAANELATGGLKPDLTILLDMSAEEGLARALKRMEGQDGPREDRFEKEGIKFHALVRKGYLEIAEKESERVRVVDAAGEVSSIHAMICGIIKERFSIGRG